MNSSPGGIYRLTRLLPRGIRERLFLLVSLLLLPLVLLSGWTYYQHYELSRRRTQQTEIEVAQGVATTFAAFVDGVHREELALGQTIVTYCDGDTAKTTYILRKAARNYPSLRNLSWAGPDGTVLASSMPEAVGFSFGKTHYFQRILNGEAWALGNLTISGAIVASPTAAIATALRDDNGILLGVMVASLEPTRLGEITLTQRRPTGGAYAIFDSQGTLVYHSRIPSTAWEDRQRWGKADDLLRRTLTTRQPQVGMVDLPFRGGIWISARVPINQTGWVAGAGQSASSAFAPIHSDMLIDALLFLPVILLAFLMAKLLGRTIVEPLRHLEHDALEAGSGLAIPSTDPNAPLEINSLRTTISGITNDMVTYSQVLSESEERFRLVLDNLTEGLLIMTTKGTIIYQNEASLRLHGLEAVEVDLTQETLISQWEISDKEGNRLSYEEWPYHRVLKGERMEETVLHLFRKEDKRDFYGSYSGIPVVDKDGEVRMAFFTVRDETAKIQAEQELQKAKDELEIRVRERTHELAQALEDLRGETGKRLAAVEELRGKERLLIQQSRLAAMGEMISNISHQWRQPLNILGLIIQEMSLLAQSGKITAQTLDAGATKAMQVIATMSQTIDDFRNFFSPDKVTALFSIKEVIEKMVFLLEGDFKKLQVQVKVIDEEVCRVNGLRNEFSQTILNILTNARDAFRERKVSEPCLTIRIFREERAAVVTIRDNAGGISEEIIDKIFDPYFTTKGPDKGTGIGLFMSKTIIEKNMGGRLSVSNTEEGAEFRIELSQEFCPRGEHE
ncbi:cache domain-containing protein [Pelotalea chapellei]|uniref:histidine kinase n=1 Tax=Pelotalea chapellei TaxID=44671 RepID=A0ABS5UD42_9BACT|nr:cache domain-containing protein [Pelotalea chapellei]MBT1073555.1 PAS domain S-box protein [Pelotalea chapellei]